MNSIFRYLNLILLFAFLSCEEKPVSTLKITGTFPSANPVGGPVKIVGEGFTEETELYFEGVIAVIEQRSDTFLTAKVPSGVSGPGVSVQVEDPTGSDELQDYFDVLDDFPNNLPTSPPSIFIPNQTLTGTMPFTMTGSEAIWHMNVYDTEHELKLLFSRVNNDDRSFEFINLNGNSYSSPAWMDGMELLDYDPEKGKANVSSIFIDRVMGSPSGHPFSSEEYSAVYFTDERFVFPDGFDASNGDITPSDNFLLLESKRTFRQYLFVVYCPPSSFCG